MEGPTSVITLERLEPKEGFEPSTDGLRNRCSATELLRPERRQILALQSAAPARPASGAAQPWSSSSW